MGGRAQILLSDPLQSLDCISWCGVVATWISEKLSVSAFGNGDNGLGEDKMRKDMKVF